MLPSSPGSIWGPPPPPAARRAAGDGGDGEAQQQEGKEQEQEAAAVLPAEHPLAGMFFSQRTLANDTHLNWNEYNLAIVSVKRRRIVLPCSDATSAEPQRTR